MADAQTSFADPMFDRLVSDFAKHQAESDELSRQLGESAKIKSGIAREILSSRPPPAPTIEPPKPPPLNAPQSDPLKSFGGIATVLGIIGGAFTRAPLTASLNAGAAAMNAYHQRDLEAYRQNVETFRLQSDYMHKVADWQQGQYKMALEAHKGNIDQLTAAMNAIASRDQDLQMKHALSTGDFRVMMQLLNDRQASMDRFRDYQFRVDQFQEQKERDLRMWDLQDRRLDLANRQADLREAHEERRDNIMAQHYADEAKRSADLLSETKRYHDETANLTRELRDIERERNGILRDNEHDRRAGLTPAQMRKDQEAELAYKAAKLLQQGKDVDWGLYHFTPDEMKKFMALPQVPYGGLTPRQKAMQEMMKAATVAPSARMPLDEIPQPTTGKGVNPAPQPGATSPATEPRSGAPLGTRQNPYKPKSQKEYDALPSGAVFQDDQGVKVKP